MLALVYPLLFSLLFLVIGKPFIYGLLLGIAIDLLYIYLHIKLWNLYTKTK
jgi:hypothetical protein